MKAFISILLSIILSLAVAEPATPTDIFPEEQAVSVMIEIDTPVSKIRIGETITLRCVVTGYDGPYFIQWQYSEDKEVWIDIPCYEEIYEFILTEENEGLYYRVRISRYE